MPSLPDITFQPSNPRFWRRGDFRDWGERVVASRLERALREHHDEQTHVLCNCIISDRRQKTLLEVDFVCISPHGVALIEVKNWCCRLIEFHGQSGCERDGRESRKDPREQPILAERVLYQFLQEGGLRDVRTNGLLLFARDDYQLKTHQDRGVPVRLLSQGIDEVVGGQLARSRRKQTRRLSEQEIIQVATEIWGAAPKHLSARKYPLSVANYAVEQPLDGDEPWAFVARPLRDSELPDEPVRLWRHDLGFTESHSEWMQKLTQARRHYDALRKLAKVPGIPLPLDFFADPSDDSVLWTVTEHQNGRPLSACPQPMRPEQRKGRLRLLAAVTRILAACHRRGVVHRMLSPSCIWLDAAGEVWIAHWPVSRIFGALTIGTQAAARLTASRYVAPEVRTNPHAAGPACDAYSLGLLLLDAWVPSEPGEERAALLKKAEGNGMPRSLLTLAERLSTDVPEGRLVDLDSVLAELAKGEHALV